MLYSIVFVSIKHQHESAIGLLMCPPSWTSIPPPSPSHPSRRLLPSPSLNSLSYTANFHWLSILYMVMNLDCKEIQPVHPKGDQSWVFVGRTDAEAETPILWPPHAKSWLFGKDPDAGRDWGQEEEGTTEDEMAGWHHRLNGHESE